MGAKLNRAAGGKIGNGSFKGSLGDPPGAQEGPLELWGLGKSLSRFFWKGLEEFGAPKGFLGAIETIPLSKRSGKPCGRPIPSQKHVFQELEYPFCHQKGTGASWEPDLDLGLQHGL